MKGCLFQVHINNLPLIVMMNVKSRKEKWTSIAEKHLEVGPQQAQHSLLYGELVGVSWDPKACKNYLKGRMK